MALPSSLFEASQSSTSLRAFLAEEDSKRYQISTAQANLEVSSCSSTSSSGDTGDKTGSCDTGEQQGLSE